MARPVATIDIDLRVDEALESIERLKYEVINYTKTLPQVSQATEDVSKRSTTALNRLSAVWDKLKLKAKAFKESLGDIVSKLKYMGLALLGMVIGSARGTTRENTSGQMLGIGFAGARGKERADEMTGRSFNFETLQEAIVDGIYNADFVKLGMDTSQFGNNAINNYFKVFDKFGEILDKMTKEQGKQAGYANFKTIYGDALNNLLGMGAGEFINTRNAGVDKKWKGIYGQTASMYSGMDTKALESGELQFANFMDRLKSSAILLSTKLIPLMDKFLGWVTRLITKLEKSKLAHATLEGIEKLVSGIVRLMELIFGGMEKHYTESGNIAEAGLKTMVDLTQKSADKLTDLMFGEMKPEEKKENKAKFDKNLNSWFKSADEALTGWFGSDEDKRKLQARQEAEKQENDAKQMQLMMQQMQTQKEITNNNTISKDTNINLRIENRTDGKTTSVNNYQIKAGQDNNLQQLGTAGGIN